MYSGRPKNFLGPPASRRYLEPLSRSLSKNIEMLVRIEPSLASLKRR